jgi:hypothetical protein
LTRSLRLLIALGLAAAAVAGAVVFVGGGDPVPRDPPGSSTRPPRAEVTPFLGLTNERLIALPREEVDEVLDVQARLRVGLLRQTFDWSEIEPAPGRHDFARYDALMEALAARGIEVLPILFNPPPFRSSAPRRDARRGTYPPRRPADMVAFGAALARRYGPAGTFWRERPALQKVPIRAWQVWNEPSLPAYWPEGPDPAAYARLLAGTAAGIRRVDPRASIVSAGLPETRIGVPFDRYLAGLYRAGGDASFDVLAIHPYSRTAGGTVRAVERARRMMDRRGDRSPIWVTEIGWASGGPPSPFTVGERGQARRVRATLLALAERRRELRVRGVVYFNWQDGEVYEGGSDFWGLHTGLLPLIGRPKPAFRAFEEAAAEVIRTVR